jgi:NAD(P)H-flavin reductase
MVDRLPGHAFLIAAGIGLGTLYLLATQIISVFAG